MQAAQSEKVDPSQMYSGISVANGKKYDSSRDRNSPFQLTLGANKGSYQVNTDVSAKLHRYTR